jgi:predicted PurR-regulated permease PerM
VVLVYLVLTVLIIALLLVVIPGLIDDANELWASLAASYQEFLATLEAYQPGDAVVEILGFEIDLDPIIEPLRDFVLRGETEELATTLEETAAEAEGETPEELLENLNLLGFIGGLIDVVAWLVGRLGGLVSGLVGYIAVLVLAAYIAFVYLLELPKIRGVMHKWTTPTYEREVGLLLFKIDETWHGFFRGQLVVAVLLAVASYIQFTLTGLPGASVLALLVGFLSLIPWIGGPIATVIVTGVALLQGSTVFLDMPNWQFALLTLAINGVLTQISSNVIQPVVYGGAVRITATSVVIGVSLGLAVGGVLGAFLVVPIMGTLRVLLHYTMSKLSQRDPYPDEEMSESSGVGFFSEVLFYH